MLEWFKRIKTPAPRAQLVDDENRTAAAEDKVKRLAIRLATDGKPAAAAPVNGPVGRPGGTRVIAVCSQKGGVGKTTIAAHLAVRAAMLGQGPVMLVDADPQGSLAEWWRARNDETLALSTMKLDNLADELATVHGHGAAIAVIDTPPALTASIVQVMSFADLIVIPARPSPHDLRAISATVDLVRRARKPFLFVVNGAANRAHITAECVAALSEHGRVAPAILYQRTEWASSMINGRTVLETAASGKSAQEITDLWDYAYAQITMRAAA